MKRILANPIPFLFLVAGLLFVSCDGSKIDPEHECSPQEVDLERDNIRDIGTAFKNPRFNPNDADEFVYLRSKPWDPSNSASIWKHTLSSDKSILITDGVYSESFLDWSTRDWILFKGDDDQLWKIKSNGDSLTGLSSTTSSYYSGTWSPDGRHIYLAHFAPSILVDENGNVTDSLDIDNTFVAPSSWSPDGEWIASFESAFPLPMLVLYNLNSKEITRIPFSQGNVVSYGIFSWFPDSKKLILCSFGDGVYTIDLGSETFVRIRKGCGQFGSSSYRYASVSPDLDKIILSHVMYKKRGRRNVDVTQSIISMDIDGTNAKILSLDD